MNSRIEATLSQLEDVQPAGRGWVSLCPAHDDHSPSLSIAQGAGGQILLHCFAGCTFEEIVHSANLNPVNLFPDEDVAGSGDGHISSLPNRCARTSGRAKESKKRDTKSSWNPFNDGKETAVYPYEDENGETVFEVIRFEVREDHPSYPDKTFRQRVPGKGWGRSRHGVEPILFRLPRVLKAVALGGVVYVCEGEKDVLTLEELGLTATCNAGGAGKWKEQYAECLARAHVVVIPDRDRAGEEHAATVARSCHKGATSVRVLRLPDLAPKEDITDWMEEGRTVEDLMSAVEQAPLFDPGQSTNEGPNSMRSEQASPNCSSADDVLDLEDAPRIPDNVYENLPAFILELAELFKQRHERDVFLTGALPVLGGCLPNVKGYYGHNAEWLSPSLYSCIIAGAASGKGPLRWCERLASGVDDLLRTESEAARAHWEADKQRGDDHGNGELSDKPPVQSLILPANTSAAAFHKALVERGGRAVLIESEIDTLVNALGQEWGKFDDSLRKAFHHERISYLRKEDEVEIREAQLSVVLSGTPRQFQRLIQSTENGLYSRMAVYYFEAPPVWIDQRPSQGARQREREFETSASQVLNLYRELRHRREPLQVMIEDEHWDAHRDTFAPMLQRAHAVGVGHLDDVIKRAGLIAFRIAQVLAVWRHWESDADLRRAERITTSWEDVEAGLGLACMYADHALRFGRTLGRQPQPDRQLLRINQLLLALPDSFTNNDVYSEATSSGLDISDRQLRHDLRRAERNGMIRSVKRSCWEKVGSEP